MTLKSLGVDKKDYNAIFKALEDIFRPEVNYTLNHFCCRNMKQKQGHSMDPLLSNLCCALLRCKYGTASSTEGAIHSWCGHL